METLAELILKTASVPVILTGTYALFKFKNLGSELKIFSYFIIFSLLIEVSSKIMWFMGMNNLPLLHLYVLIGFIFQTWFYARVLERFISKKIIWTIGGLFVCFTIVNSLFFESVYTFNSNALTVQSILVIILSISTYMLFLNDIVKSETDMNLMESLNWINSGLFIYYSSSLLVFYVSDLLIENYSLALNQYTWTIHTIFLIVMYVCFFIGLWKRPRKLIS